MKRKIVGILICAFLVTTFFVTTGVGNEADQSTTTTNPTATRQEFDFGDAPEGPTAIAYPSLGVMGSFPTCINCGPSMWVQHMNFGAWFGQSVDLEPEGNGGLCPQCFPPYDQDETFQDGDAGLMIPEPFTIDNSLNVVPFPGYTGTPLGLPGQTAIWGTDVDIWVHNTMPGHEPYLPAFVNVMIDWNQNGFWSDVPGEHILINFVVPPLYIGPLSALTPPNFVIGPNFGYVWARFSITEYPVQPEWPGEGYFEDGESEDYLLQIQQPHQPVPAIGCNGSLSWTNVKPGTTVTGTFGVGNIGDPGSFLDWEVSNYPAWGTWSFNPPSGTGLAQGSWVTVTATVIAPKIRTLDTNPAGPHTGVIEIRNKNDHTDFCTISVSLTTPRARTIGGFNLIYWILENYPNILPILRHVLT